MKITCTGLAVSLFFMRTGLRVLCLFQSSSLDGPQLSPDAGPQRPTRQIEYERANIMSKHSHDVSPIDEVPDMSSLGRPRQSSAPSQPKSNIPMMRRQRRHEQDAANAMLREAKSRERLRSSSLRQPARDGQEASREATGRQVFKVAQGREMRWDAMTGEPTLGSTGLSGQVKPVEYAQGLKAPSAAAASSGPSTAALERLRNAQSSFGEKVKKLTSPTAPAQPPVSPAPGPEPEPESEHVSDASPPVARSESPTSPPPATTTRPPRKSSLGNSTPAPRPEWKGASGRTAIVPPVQDTPQPAPLRIPRKSSKRERYADKGRRGAGGPQSLSPISPSESETSLHRADPTAGKMTSPQQATPSPNLDGRAADEQYPSPPHSGSAPPPSHADPDRVADAKPSSPTTPVSMSMDNAKATRRKPPSSAAAANASHHNPHFSVASSIYSTFDTTTVPHPSGTTNITVTTRVPKSEPVPAPERPAATTPPAQDNWVPPPSRFSITTYATSAHTRSPGASVDLDAPPVPTPPREHTQSLQPKGGASEPADMRKAGALGQDHQRAWPNGAPSIMSERPGSVASTSKALPPAPPEMQTANDRVGYLNARLESLANRRININKSIVKMTELMPTDNLMASDAVLKKREVEKMKVEGLRAELAEVQRMEYELGLKLHRAYKRLDREAEFEPTTLWIRRVTG